MRLLISVLTILGIMVVGVESASASSSSYCQNYAKHIANQQAAGGAVGGAIVGGVGGALLGGLFGGKKGVGTGAIVGGVGGALVGGTSQWQQAYNNAYYQCINSGPVQAYPIYALPPVGSHAWRQACAAKYGSYVPGPIGTPGTYTGYDGQLHYCSLP